MRSDRVKRLLSATVGAATAASATGQAAWCVSGGVTLLRLGLWTLWVCVSAAVFITVLEHTHPRGAGQEAKSPNVHTPQPERRTPRAPILTRRDGKTPG